MYLNKYKSEEMGQSMNYRKLGMLLSGLLVVGVLTACGGNDKEETDITPENIVQDEEKTDDILKEEGITAGQVYLEKESDMMVTTMVADSEVDEEKIKELAEKYAEELKKEYPDKKVNVQAVKDGKNIANVIKE